MLDKTDKIILNLLQNDANITNKEIAALTGLTITPVYERVKKMLFTGIIKQNVALLDRKKIGLDLMVLISISLKHHMKADVNHFMEVVVKLIEVVECFHLTGTFDFQLKVLVSDMDEYQDFLLNKLSALDNIGHIESYFVMTEVKNTTSLPIKT